MPGLAPLLVQEAAQVDLVAVRVEEGEVRMQPLALRLELQLRSLDRVEVGELLGGTGSYPSTEFALAADGSTVAGVAQGISSPGADTGSIRTLPDATAIPAGSTLSVSGGNNGVSDARAWGPSRSRMSASTS